MSDSPRGGTSAKSESAGAVGVRDGHGPCGGQPLDAAGRGGPGGGRQLVRSVRPRWRGDPCHVAPYRRRADLPVRRGQASRRPHVVDRHVELADPADDRGPVPLRPRHLLHGPQRVGRWSTLPRRWPRPHHRSPAGRRRHRPVRPLRSGGAHVDQGAAADPEAVVPDQRRTGEWARARLRRAGRGRPTFHDHRRVQPEDQQHATPAGHRQVSLGQLPPHAPDAEREGAGEWLEEGDRVLQPGPAHLAAPEVLASRNALAGRERAASRGAAGPHRRGRR